MSDIIVKFKPSGHKELIAAINKLNVAQGGATAATKKHTKATNGALSSQRLLGGSFATMRSHLLLYSFAMSLGVKQLGEFAKESAKLQQMERAFGALTGASESSAVGMIKLRTATLGTMSSIDLLKQANNAMILGVTKNTDEMSEMFSMAKRLGDALGVDTTRSVESLVTGIGRQSRLMLDNIGIIVKSDDAYKQYAKTLDKSVDQLTDAEKKQAFMNATLEAARKKVAQLPPQTKLASDQFAKFGASMKDLSLVVGSTIAPTLGDFAEGISDFIGDLLLSDTEKLIKDLRAVGVSTQELAELTELINFQDALNVTQDFGILIKDSGTLSAKFDLLGDKAKTSFKDKITSSLQDMGLELKNMNSDEVFGMFQKGMVSEDVFAGIKNFRKELSQIGKLVTVYEEDNVRINDAQQGLSKGAIESGNRIVKANQEEIDKLTQKADVYTNLINQGAALFGVLVKQEKAQAVLNGTIDDGNKDGDDPVKSLLPEIAALNEKAIIQQALKLNEQELNDIKKTGLETTDEVFDKEKRGNALLKTQISLKQKLNDIENKTIDARLKAANKVASVVKQGLQLTGASAKATANVESVMAMINAIGSGLRIKNSPMMTTNPIAATAYAAATVAAGIGQAMLIQQQANKLGGGGAPQFEQGGYVGGRRHSQGGTMIEAERGEFVMSRNAVESIGTETLNQMNQGGGGGNINVSVTGNVLTQDFVEGELAEAIKEAARRGSDFGLS